MKQQKDVEMVRGRWTGLVVEGCNGLLRRRSFCFGTF